MGLPFPTVRFGVRVIDSLSFRQVGGHRTLTQVTDEVLQFERSLGSGATS